MNAIKNVSIICILALLVFACQDDNLRPGLPVDNYDHIGQKKTDELVLDDYFRTHYYNTLVGGIWTIGGTSFFDLPIESQIPLNQDKFSDKDEFRLKELYNIVANDTTIKYTMYYYVIDEGTHNPTGDDEQFKGKASLLDSVLVNYKGMLLDSTVFDSSGRPTWFDLRSTGNILGFRIGLTQFKGGELVTDIANNDFSYKNFSKGFIFFPSGLGYRNASQGVIPANSPLIFEVDMFDVNLTDDDFDLVPSRDEVEIEAISQTINRDFIDTDKDGAPDYLDVDDDDDGILTKDEIDTNKDGDWSNAELAKYLSDTYGK